MQGTEFDIARVAQEAGISLRGRGEWRRAFISRKQSCPFCGSRTGMSLNVKGNFFVCHSCGEKGDSVQFYGKLKGVSRKQALRELKRGGFSPGTAPAPAAKKPQPAAPASASLAERDRVYRALLSKLFLLKAHRENLLSRGLGRKDIEARGYRSLPPGKAAARIARELVGEGHSLAGVPGFYRLGSGAWTFTTYKDRCFLIPIRDSKGRIQSFQLRFDGGDVRYKAFSSAGLPGGAAAVSPVHFAKAKAKGKHSAYLTEGALKGDVIATLGGLPVFSVLGITSQRYLPAALKWFKANGGGTIYIVFDADFVENIHVMEAMREAAAKVAEAGLAYKMLVWPGAYRKDGRLKGFDDLLAVAAKEKKIMVRTPVRKQRRRIDLSNPASWA